MDGEQSSRSRRKYITEVGKCVLRSRTELHTEPWGRGPGPKTWGPCDSGLARMSNENTSKRAMFHDRIFSASCVDGTFWEAPFWSSREKRNEQHARYRSVDCHTYIRTHTLYLVHAYARQESRSKSTTDARMLRCSH